MIGIRDCAAIEMGNGPFVSPYNGLQYWGIFADAFQASSLLQSFEIENNMLQGHST